ncbi:hypothetical protein CpecG_0023 [Chlamydia pecorum MC/MarsBar]|uniref:DUF720 domain-containing protein n=1 Tax=Chlamydia pecorum TaxID=85991 RepID=UPI0003D3B58A|nr:DUF720 domain-containing protein [Chlamydia pecorum]ETF38923.1 hypothetical protein CpecF_0023 [Chlamydia pecorum DBDeUG]ETF39599.1 hypothetical protein CpecG_0023 [Chlamydia pecorum MC/MarsBar]ETF40648.1 hypothetical protein CpecA_0023 [Chlamydia pecorum IPTaLE]UBV31614.1 hypothetical protein MarsBar_0026 [Chlamydia pecorum]UBV32558.1 hypothetical protein DBDeUG_0026 [Chlamydia pecorum]
MWTTTPFSPKHSFLYAAIEVPESTITGGPNTTTADDIIAKFAKDSNPLIITVYYVYQSVLVAQNNLEIISEELQANASAQTYLNNQEALYQYVTIPKNKLNDNSSTLLQNIQSQNQAVGASRQALQNQISGLGNSAQVISSNLNTNNNIIQQSLQVGQALIQTFSQIVSLIANI